MDTGVRNSLHTYTPVRRPEASINGRQLHGDQEKEWTAARCHRLLRALTSRVAILTKDLARFQQQNRFDPISKNTLPCIESVRINGKASDENWLKSKKRIIRTYSTKGKKPANSERYQANIKGRKSIVPGEVLVPTPVLARARRPYSFEEVIPAIKDIESEQCVTKVKRRKTCYGAGNVNGEFQLSSTLREIRHTTTSTRYSTYEGIYNGLEALLRATMQCAVEPKRKGAGSLVSMALRAVPRYINEQEALLRAHMEETGSKSAIENRDVSVEIYDELEAYGSSGYGWKRLSVIVRAHGIQVISDAIISGLLDVEFCGILISVCIHMEAIEEGQTLLSALLSSTKFTRPRALSNQVNKSMSMLWKFSQHTSRFSFQIREMSRLILEDQLPLEWLATKEFGPFWAGLIQCLTPNALDDDVLGFMEVLLLKLLYFPTVSDSPSNTITDAVCNTFSSLLTTLCSIIILSQEIEQQTDMDKLPEEPQLAALLEICMLQSRPKLQHSDSTYVLLLLANVILRDNQNGNHETKELVEELSKLLKKKYNQSTNYAQAAMFICQIARCCGRGTSSFGFEHLQQIHLRLEVLTCTQEGSEAMKGLIVDSAFAFARKVPDRQHIDYAATMDATYCTRSAEVEASLLELSDSDVDENRSGFRWEEGIGEWVTATPGTSGRKQVSMMEIESDEDTPFKPPPNLRRRVEQTPSIVTRSVLYSDNIDELEGPSQNSLQHLSSPNRQEIIDISSDSEQTSASRLSVQPTSSDELGSESSESDSSDEQSNDQWNASIDDDKSHIEAQDQTKSSESEQSDSGMDETTDQIELSFDDESIISVESPERASNSAEILPHSTRHNIYRTPRLTKKLFHSRQSYQLFSSSDQSLASLSASSSNSSPITRREFVDRAPRLGRRALRSSQAWEVFEESDDELSFLSVSSSSTSSAPQVHRPLQEMTNRCNNKKQTRRTIQKQKTKIITRKRAALEINDSEDELCI